MSRIFKKLNIEDESSVDKAPDLKLVQTSEEEPRASKPKKGLKFQEKKKQAQGQLKVATLKRSGRRLMILAVCAAIAVVVLIGGRHLYQKVSPFMAELNTPSKKSPAAIESVSAKAKLAVDEQVHHDAMELFHEHDYAKALEKFEFLLKKHPGDAVLTNNIGMTYSKLNDLPKAEKYFQDVLKIDQKDGAAYNNLGSLKMSQFNWEEATAYFYQAILYHPEMLEPHLNLAKAFEMAGRPMEAIPEYQHYLDHAMTTSDPAIRKLIEKRIVQLGSFSRYIGKDE